MRSLRQLLPSPGGLFAFEAAARRGSFTLAGEELGMSQAAVSYAIKKLEGALGTALFLRRHRGVELTEAGERFYNDVSIGLAYIRRSAESLERLRADDHVTLSVSTAFARSLAVAGRAASRARSEQAREWRRKFIGEGPPVEQAAADGRPEVTTGRGAPGGRR